MHAVPTEAIRGRRIIWNWSEPLCGCWKLNPGPLQKPPGLLTAEASLQLQHHKSQNELQSDCIQISPVILVFSNNHQSNKRSNTEVREKNVERVWERKKRQHPVS